LCDGPMPLQGREVGETVGRGHLRWRQGWPRQRPPGTLRPQALVDGLHNLTDDPELRYTEARIARAMFRVAVSGRREQKPSFFTAVVWRDQAEHAAKSLAKGSRVVVIGRLQQRAWTLRMAAPARSWRSWPRSWGRACAGRRRRRPGRRGARTGSQLDQLMRRRGTPSMPAFRSVVSVLVRFVSSRVSNTLRGRSQLMRDSAQG
jgi:hypothetical protein